MMPQTAPREDDNPTKTSLLISLVFHLAIIVALVFFAARERGSVGSCLSGTHGAAARWALMLGS